MRHKKLYNSIQFLFLKKIIIFIVLFIIIDNGIYFFLHFGLEKYYNLTSNENTILINGTSMSHYGINSTLIQQTTKSNIAKFTKGGVNIEDRFQMLQFYLNQHDSGKVVIYEINPTLLDASSKISISGFTVLYPFLYDKNVSEYIKKQTDLKSFYLRKIIKTTRFDIEMILLSIRGYLNKQENWRTGEVNNYTIKNLQKKIGMAQIKLNDKNIEVFLNTMNLFKQHNCYVFLVNMPLLSYKLQTYKTESYDQFLKFFQDYCDSNQNFSFIDCNDNNNLTTRLNFFDPVHLNINGQINITNYLIENMKHDTSFLHFQDQN